MSLKLESLSIRTKVFIGTSVTLSILLLIYIVIFNHFFFNIKNDAFNDYKLLSNLDHQIAYISMSKQHVTEEKLDKIIALATKYQYAVSKNDIKQEKAEFEIAHKIITYSVLYKQQHLKVLNTHSLSPLNQQLLVDELSHIELRLINIIHQSFNIIQTEADQSLEALFYYEILSSSLLFVLILFLSMYGINLVIKPLIKLRKSIEEFQGGKHSQINTGDEIKRLIDAFFSMKNEIKHKQELLEEAVIEAQDANQAKTEFLANISHELRTPMLGILGFAELGVNKLEKVEKHKLLKYFERIHTSGSRLLLLLNNLLDLSKLEAGEMHFDFEESLINDVMGNVLIELDSLICNKNIHIITESPINGIMVEMDVLRIHQVLYNIINNAIKFSPDQGVILIEISQKIIQQQERKINVVEIDIQDQGVGVPEEEMHYIFEKFSQSSHTDTGAGGTGLGLSICKDICDYHHAVISVANLIAPQKGAKFTIQIPLLHQ